MHCESKVFCPHTEEHNTMTRPGLEPGPLDPESIALTSRPPRLPLRRNKILVGKRKENQSTAETTL